MICSLMRMVKNREAVQRYSNRTVTKAGGGDDLEGWNSAPPPIQYQSFNSKPI